MDVWDALGVSVIFFMVLIYGFLLEVLRRALRSGIDMRLK